VRAFFLAHFGGISAKRAVFLGSKPVLDASAALYPIAQGRAQKRFSIGESVTYAKAQRPIPDAEPMIRPDLKCRLEDAFGAAGLRRPEEKLHVSLRDAAMRNKSARTGLYESKAPAKRHALITLPPTRSPETFARLAFQAGSDRLGKIWVWRLR
jgi:hypothetical protein